MVGRRVFVIWKHPLFHEMIRLLLERYQVELVGATSDSASAQDSIQDLAPDVVIIEETDNDEQVGEQTVAILQTGPRVIRLSMTENDLHIYQREQRTVGKVEDLMNLISDSPGEDIQSGKSDDG